MFPHPTQIWFFSHHVPHSSPIRLLFHNLAPLHICQWFFSFCVQVYVETLLTQVSRTGFIAFIHHYQTPAVSSCGSIRCIVCHHETGALAERTPRSVPKFSFPPLPAPYSFLLSHNPVFLRIPPELLFFFRISDLLVLIEHLSSPSQKLCAHGGFRHPGPRKCLPPHPTR